MDPQHQAAHVRLWTDATRRACPVYVAAPASLLAFTAWQGGDGALAGIALDRALADDPAYSMARLLAGCTRRRTAAVGSAAADDPGGGRRKLRPPVTTRLEGAGREVAGTAPFSCPGSRPVGWSSLC